MDEIGTADIRKLPNSGRISLSEIQGEFNKGNNLTDYYGVVSGIPSSGTIKLTDFYGKEQGGGGSTVAPSGSYSSSRITHFQTTDPNAIGSPQFSYSNLYWCKGAGAGNPVAWGDDAGVLCADRTDYASCTLREISVQGNSQSINSYYPYLTVGPTQGPGDYRRYPGSWKYHSVDNFYETGTGGPVFRKTYTSFSNKTAAEYLWSIMQQGLPFYIAVSNTAREELVIDGVVKEFTLYEEPAQENPDWV
jgi:hypothetical protein